MKWWLLSLTAVGFWQAGVMLAQARERNLQYARAKCHAEATGKPMLVVGGPWGDNPLRHLLRTRAHGYGDVCYDISRYACEGALAAYQGDVRDMPFADKTFGAVLVSHVLEHMPTAEDCETAVRELARVADSVFVAGPSKQSIVAWLIPEHRLWVRQKGGRLIIEERNLWRNFVQAGWT